MNKEKKEEIKRAFYKTDVAFVCICWDLKEHKCNHEYRRVMRRLCRPSWADTSKIAEIRKERDRLSKKFGMRYSTDHIIPIISDEVCGLDVPENIQILRLDENKRKSNKVSLDKVH